MDEKEFSHLSRKELVDIIYELEKRIEKKMLKLKIFTSSWMIVEFFGTDRETSRKLPLH